MKLQDDLFAALRDGLGTGFTVQDYPAPVDAAAKPTVLVWATTADLLPHAPGGHYAVEFTIELLTKYQDPQLAEDDLGDTLAAVLAVLWERTDYLLTKATRATNEARTIHAWQLTVTGGLEITPEA